MFHLECDKDGICKPDPGKSKKSSFDPTFKLADKRYSFDTHVYIIYPYIYIYIFHLMIITNTNNIYSFHFHGHKFNAQKLLDQSAIEIHDSETPIYWELNWMNQEDPYLIQFIREKILIPPPGSLEEGNLT